MRTPTIFVFLALILATTALYDKYSAVKLLTASDFSQVKKGIWLVEFFAPWCGHCKSLAPEYEKAAKALKGIANIAAIDASNERTDIQIQGYPTIKLFIDGKITEYDGPRTGDGVVDFMLKKFRNVLNV